MLAAATNVHGHRGRWPQVGVTRHRDNLADAALRILIGIVAAGVLVLMLSSRILPSFTIGNAGISGTDISWQTVLVIGFVAGFLERLVPDLLEQATAPHADKAAAPDKAIADRVAVNNAAVVTAMANKATADKAVAEKAAVEEAAIDKAVTAKAAAGEAASL